MMNQSKRAGGKFCQDESKITETLYLSCRLRCLVEMGKFVVDVGLEGDGI